MSKTWYSPTGTEIVGTLETVTCRADVHGIMNDGMPDYAGNTEVFWDEQKPVERDGKIIFLDEDGAEWTFDQLTTEDPGRKHLEEERNDLLNSYTGKAFADGLITARLKEIEKLLEGEDA